MKTLVTAYTFDKVAKTVTFTGFGTISLSNILLITNTTSNTIIYLFSDPALGGTVSTNVLSLTFNTSSMSNTDVLQIFYDVNVLDSNNYMEVHEQYAPAAEDNTNQVIAQQIRPITGSTY